MNGPVIEARGLVKAFGRHVAVDDLSFAVHGGRVTGFLGRIGALVSIVGQAAMAGVAVLLAAQKGATLSLAGDDFVAAGGLLVACLLWALIGTGIGAIVRQPVAAVVGAVVWMVIVENAAGGLLQGAARFLPGQAGHAVALVFRTEGLLPPLVGGGLLAAYALVVLLLGLLLFTRRDVAPA